MVCAARLLTDKVVHVSVIAGLAVGIALIVVFASMFSPATAKTDSQLIESTRDLKEVRYFLSKYPEATVAVDRPTYEAYRAVVTYSFDKQLCESDPDAFGDNCIKTIMLDVIMKPIGPVRTFAGCGGPISGVFITDPIAYIESGDCFASQ